MKKLLLLLFIIPFVLILSGCSGKVPFRVEQPKESAGIVYVYIADDTYADDTFVVNTYNVTVNKNETEDSIKIGEYLKFDVNPGSISFGVVLGGMEISTLTLNVQEEKIYYLRGRSTSSNPSDFEFQEMIKDSGVKEITKFVLASEYIKTNAMLNALLDSDKNQTKQKTSHESSKLDEIQKAYEMKKEGLLTEKEFKTMKAKILAK